MSRYVIPYTAPSGARGTLTVTAASAADALAKAEAIHTTGRYPITPALPAAGPGVRNSGKGHTMRALPKKERDGMTYGEPALAQSDPARERLEAGARASLAGERHRFTRVPLPPAEVERRVEAALAHYDAAAA